MRKRLKKELARLYEAPPAQRKEEFFWGVEKPGISHWQFLRIQISYVRKWNWAVALLMLATVNLGWLEGQILWIMGAVTPFLPLAVAAECSRSRQCGMEELELVSRFSMKYVVVSRILILGLCDLLVLVFLVCVGFSKTRADLLYCSGMVLSPYLVNAFLSMWIVRRVHGREGTYLCMVLTVIVSTAVLLLRILGQPLPELIGAGGMAVGLLVLTILTVRECVKFIEQSEEYVWN